MAQKTNFSGSTVYIEKQRIGYITNTIKFKTGEGEDVVTVIDLGGGTTDIQAVLDNSTRKSTLAFEIKSNVEDVDNILTKFKQLQRTKGGLSIELLTPNKKQYAFTKAVITNDPEVEVSPEGNFTLEIEGMPVKKS